ncbi:MAG: hypothetical protein AABW50_00760 [Nanoarchaeota archaeon]
MKESYKLYTALLVLFAIIILAPKVNSVGEISFCCEKTTSGAWCMNAPEAECNEDYRSVPTSCQATSFCKLGWCYDSQEGTCLPNVPQVVCSENNGVWSVGESEPPQCSLGCCVLGDQASFVTQTSCKALSADYGLETNFRSDIKTELECISSVTSEEEGACVFEEDFQRTCQRTTQKKCSDMKKSSSDSNVEFYAGVLCSAEDLGTNCGPTEQTTCIEGKDEVFYLDSCGNLANIYDSSKQNSKEYWTKIFGWDESCGVGKSNAGSNSCGNCDYFAGSTCKQYERGVDRVKPVFGNYICRDLSCKDEDFKKENNRYPQHGESWCVSNSEKGNVPGAEYYREVCYNSEITIENCASYRQEICIENEIPTRDGILFSARCSANFWQDCIAQENKDDCENEQRDCVWTQTKDDEKKLTGEICVPRYAPGFDFWKEESDATNICSIASAECVAKFEKGLLEGTWDCKENCHCCVNGKFGDKEYEGCTGSTWGNQLQNICTSLGDCGPKLNYEGAKGYGYNNSLVTVDGEPLEQNTKPPTRR